MKDYNYHVDDDYDYTEDYGYDYDDLTTRRPLPAFLLTTPNVTATRGEEAILTCAIDNIGPRTVSTYVVIKSTGVARPPGAHGLVTMRAP